jgi:NhaP-type Na+/H+ or K+/H+ antiporter
MCLTPTFCNEQVFYNILIPPIVFYAGFSVKKKLFFKNLVTIAIFGVLGCCATGAHSLEKREGRGSA